MLKSTVWGCLCGRLSCNISVELTQLALSLLLLVPLYALRQASGLYHTISNITYDYAIIARYFVALYWAGYCIIH
jgi:hypothetical protein